MITHTTKANKGMISKVEQLRERTRKKRNNQMHTRHIINKMEGMYE